MKRSLLRPTAFILLAQLCLTQCTSKSEDASELKDWDQVKEFEQMTDAQLIISLANEESIYGVLDSLMERGDSYRRKAEAAIQNDERLKVTSSAYQNKSRYAECLKTSAKPQEECTLAGNIPTEAAGYYQQATKFYSRVLALFSGSSLESLNTQTLVEQKCEGKLSRDHYLMCKEVLKSGEFFSRAKKSLKPEGAATAGTLPGDSIKRASRLVAAGEQILNRLTNYRSLAYERLMGINLGLDSSTDFVSVPFISVLAKPEELIEQLKGELEGYRRHVLSLVDAQKAVQSNNIDNLTTENAQSELKRREKEYLDEQVLVKTNDAVYSNERNYILDKIKKIKEQKEKNLKNFSLEMRSVLGNVGSTSQLKTEMLAIRPRWTFRSSEWNQDGFKKTISRDTKTMIDISVPEVQYRSNAIYANVGAPLIEPALVKMVKKDPLGLPSQGWDKAIMQTLHDGYQSGCDLGEEGNEAFADELGKRIPGFVGDLAGNFAQYLDTGRGAEFKEAFTEPSLGSIGNLISSGPQALNDGAAILLKSILPPGPKNGADLVRDLCKNFDGLPAPKQPSHVKGQSTNANGYILSMSEGRSTGSDSGASSDESLGINVGVSFEVSVAPLGLGPSGGFNAGIDKSVSVGSSVGGSIGKSSDLSMMLGFYDRKAKYPTVRVGMLMAEVYCTGQVNEGRAIEAFPVGLNNIITIDPTKPAYQNCARTADGEDFQIIFVVNDQERAQAKDQKCSFNGKVQDCVEDVSIPVQLTYFSNVSDNYAKMKELLDHKDTRNAIMEAAYSSDPHGTVQRIFQQKANKAGISPALIESFKMVVDHTTAVLLDEKELLQQAYELRNLDARIKQINHSISTTQLNLELIHNEIGTLYDIKDIRTIYTRLLKSERDVESNYTDYYLNRLSRWFKLYQKSMLYHYNRVVDSSVLDSITQSRFSEDFADVDDQSEANELKETIQSRINEFRITEMLDNEKDNLWVKNITLQGGLQHCYADLSEIVDFSSAYGADECEGDASCLDRTYLVTSDSPLFNPTVASELLTLENRNPIVAADYIRIPVLTDPSRANKAAPRDSLNEGLAPLLSGHNPKMRCTHPGSIGLSKIIGVAFTYRNDDLFNSFNDLKHVMVEHDPTMFTYLPKNSGTNLVEETRIFRQVDFESFGGLSGFGSLRSGMFPNTSVARPVSIAREQLGIVFDSCYNTSNSYDWLGTNEEGKTCMGALMPSAVIGDIKWPLTLDVSKSFYNSYLGGTWYVYLPYVRNPEDTSFNWYQFRKGLKGMRMHFYFVKDQAVGG